MYTSHNPCWDAKNRYDLPEEVPFDYSSIKHIIEPAAGSRQPDQKQPHACAQPEKPDTGTSTPDTGTTNGQTGNPTQKVQSRRP